MKVNGDPGELETVGRNLRVWQACAELHVCLTRWQGALGRAS